MRGKLAADKTPYRDAPNYLVVYEFQTYDLRSRWTVRLAEGALTGFPPGSAIYTAHDGAGALPLSSARILEAAGYGWLEAGYG